uniref:Ankyrin repeat domain 2 n=1 Tax=Pavo cristatus TaxID=9049 RepID=A0A8C9FRW9_PAVCR
MELDGEKGKELEVEQITELDGEKGKELEVEQITELDVEKAKELIDQKLAEEEEEEKRLKGDGPREPLAVERMNTPELEEEKRQGCCMSPQGQDRVRRSSVDLRREIIDVGSIQRLIELRKQRRKRREERAATPEPTPPPEPEEIEGPVEPEDFLRAAVQGKIRVIEKFLADGGPPDTCDEVVRTPLHVATRTGHLDIVEHLIHCGVDINSPDRVSATPRCSLSQCPLGDAVHRARLHLLQEGDTALHDATRLSRYKIIKMLILHGADMMARNLAGKTPTDLVQQWQVDTRQALETKERPQDPAPGAQHSPGATAQA